MHLRQHSRQHIRHFWHFPGVFLPNEPSALLLNISKKNIRNLTMAIIKEPNAKEPKWYLKALLIEVNIIWPSVPFSWLKYQIEVADA